LAVHQCTDAVDENYSYVVDASIVPTTWVIQQSDLAVIQKVFLKDGDFIRIFHKEGAHLRYEVDAGDKYLRK
jgi:hypothetical protein